MECLSEKLGDRYPIGKTAVVGDQVIPVSSTGEAVASRLQSGPSPQDGADGPDEVSDGV